ncbi:MAG: dTDP-4-amino-4,6-dideoxygalactose transaminase [Spirochaetes bacterium]|nr:dTDP-4-amino-4,6-dideoxygalactose transaminase [Spirochaetota bacterium]
MNIPFNKVYTTGNEAKYIAEAISQGKLSGNGEYTRRCQTFLERRYLLKKTLLTTSCTDALELAALLIDLKPGDEVILPSYTFVSTANAFALRGAKLVFADSQANHPNLDAEAIEPLITERTRAIVPVHYGGQACDMKAIMELAARHALWVIEDAAQAIESRYDDKWLGGVGHLGAFSFHETKNIICGEGGALAINHEPFQKRAEILWEKGTNRSAFFRGEVDKYGWVDVGSSFLPSELNAAFLWAQFEALDDIQNRRMAAWQVYHTRLTGLAKREILIMPDTTHNAHLFYIVCRSLDERTRLIAHLKSQQISSVFHYLSLHKSPYFATKHDGRILKNADRFTDCLVRLPMYAGLSITDAEKVAAAVGDFFEV